MAADTPQTRSEGRWIALAFVIGMATDVVSIAIGNPYIVSGLVLVTCVLATALRGEHPRPWIFLATILAANPVNLNAPVACNLIFAICLLIIGMKHLRGLPKWVYLVNCLAVVAITLSSLNWLFSDGPIPFKTQIGAYINYLLGPFLLLPVIYSGLGREKNSRANFTGFLYFIVVPSTFLFFLAYAFGTPVAGQGGLVQTTTNLTVFKLGNTFFYLIRTQSGFVIASLICGAVAALVSPVGLRNKVLAACCLAFNAYLLLVSGSVSSALAAMCGVAAIFLASMFRVHVAKYLLVIMVACGLLFAVWNFTDTGIKKYVTKRYEERFTKKGINATDRLLIWKLALGYMESHPEGVGWSLFIDEIRTYPHNDYFTYAIAYSLLGGVLYLYVIIRIGRSLFRRPRDHAENPYELAVRIAGLGIFVVILLNSATDHLTANRWYFNVAWSMLWFAFFSTRAVSARRAIAGVQLSGAK